MTKILCTSYVWHDDKCFKVNTINRPSGIFDYPEACHSETIVWVWYPVKNMAGEFIWQAEDISGSINTHLKICGMLHDTGTCEVEDEV